MKKTLAIISALVLLGAAAFAKPAKSNSANAAADVTAPAGKGSIAVPAPKGVNLGDGADWIPLFIQGVITANFQQYSGLTVIDRQNADMVKAEQRLSESAEFDEKNAIELGKMTSARLIVTGNIMAKSNAYALTFNITDTQTGESKATASVPDCPRSALEDATAANQISYDLMVGYGIALGDDAKKNLTQKATVMAAETNAQASVAKGIAAEKSGSNIEALTYYIQAKKSDRNLSEATSRMAGMTTVVTSGNFGANAKNLMKLRNDWDKLLLEAAGLIAANPPEFELHYFTDIEPLALTEKDYANKTMSFRIGAPYLMQVSGEDNGKIAAELLTSMKRIEQSKDWGAKMNGFPWTYADDIRGDNWLKWANAKKTEPYPCTVTLLEANKKSIAKKPYTLYVKYDKKYAGFEITSDNKSNRNFDYGVPSLTISDVPVGNADTDKMYISVENTGSKKLTTLPFDGMPVDVALNAIKTGNHSGTIKIGGFLGWNSLNEVFSAIKSNTKPIELVLSELLNINGKGPKGRITFREFPPRRDTSLTRLVLPEGIAEIGDGEFANYTSLKNLTIPASVTKIGSGAFGGCTSLANVTLPEGITAIWDKTFYGCTSLASVTIPASVTAIGSNAFYGCKSRITVNYAGTKEEWEKIRIAKDAGLDRAKVNYNYKEK